MTRHLCFLISSFSLHPSSFILFLMSYQVIARKWRPQKFEDVTGQEILTQTLRNSIKHGRLHHAYLFSGARGVGKTTTARLVARALNCQKAAQPTPTPCAPINENACASCREVAEGRSMDVLEIDAASNTQVENVREVIIAGVNIAPARDRYKIFIIDEVHMLSGHSFNALLKTIEEPPPRVMFIMATTDEHKVPETIASRCQIFEFRTIATSKIADRLRLIAKAEEISISDDAIREIARAGEGSMRDAQSALDQVISFAGEKISTEDVEKALGIVGADVLARVIKGIAENKPSEALAIVDDLVVRGHNLRNFCRDLLGHLRDLLVVKVSGDPKLLDSASTQIGTLEEQTKLFSESDLVRFFHALAETESTLKDAANPRYQVEVGLVKLMEMRRLAPLGNLIDRIAELERSVRTGTPSVQDRVANAQLEAGSQIVEDSSSFVLEDAQTEKIQSVSQAGATDSFREQIKSALEQKKRRLLIAAIDGARRVELDGDELLIEFSPDEKHFRDTLAKADSAKLLREICCELCHREIGVRFTIQAADAARDEPSSPDQEKRQSKQKARHAAAQNPAVQQALRTFGGEIVDVKPL